MYVVVLVCVGGDILVYLCLLILVLLYVCVFAWIAYMCGVDIHGYMPSCMLYTRNDSKETNEPGRPLPLQCVRSKNFNWPRLDLCTREI